MGDDEQRLYEPYALIDGEWVHIGEGTILEATNISGGEAIENLMRSYKATCEILDDCSRRLAASALQAIRKHSRSRRKAIDRSRRNSETVKRCAHGRARRTRGRRRIK